MRMTLSPSKKFTHVKDFLPNNKVHDRTQQQNRIPGYPGTRAPKRKRTKVTIYHKATYTDKFLDFNNRNEPRQHIHTQMRTPKMGPRQRKEKEQERWRKAVKLRIFYLALSENR